jgi:DNA-binding MarR family transcriptional regulator
LAAIELLGMPTLGELAAREGVQPPSVTRIVGALEEMGLVRRVADEADRRVARVELLPEGRRTLARNRSARTAYLAARLQRLAPAERAALADLIALLERIEDLEDSGGLENGGTP